MSEHFDGDSPLRLLRRGPDRPRRVGACGACARGSWRAWRSVVPWRPCRRSTAGRLTVHLPDGSMHQGGSPASALHATMWIDDEAFFGEFARRGDIGFGESYMAGHFRTDNLVSLLEIGIRNEAALPQVTWLTRLLNLGNDLQHRLRPNTRAGSRRNIHAHYDLSNELFALFLDPEMVYSAAYYEQADDTLEQAQQQKFRRLAEAVGLHAGAARARDRVRLGRVRDVRGPHLRVPRDGHHRLAGAVRARRRPACGPPGCRTASTIRLCDYRDVDGAVLPHRVDRDAGGGRAASTGRRSSRSVTRGSRPGGAIAIQTIGMPDHRFEVYARHADWIQKYIFPGGMLPSIGALLEASAATTPLTLRWMRRHRAALRAHAARVAAAVLRAARRGARARLRRSLHPHVGVLPRLLRGDVRHPPDLDAAAGDGESGRTGSVR